MDENENSFMEVTEFDSPTITQDEKIFDDHQLSNKLPLDLRSLSKIEIRNGADVSHIIKYEMQDGKLTKIWECGTCHKKFGHQYILMRHLPIHTDERKFQCTVCGKAFRQMSTLSQHRAIHSSERPYVCDVCPKTFNRISTLISHRKTHVGIKPHKCNLCNKAFHQKGNLRNHIFTHTNERPYKCDYCGKGFNQTSNLMCHKLKIHQEINRPNFSCQTCGKQFLRRVALRNHEQSEHPLNNNIISNYENIIFVDPIKTKAMQRAIETSQIPFALFRPLFGIPVMVKVLPAGSNRHMLVPATAEDLKKHGQISVTDEKLEDAIEDGDQKPVGSTVQIKIPVVATIIQQAGGKSRMTMSIINHDSNNKILQDISNGDFAENLPAIENFETPVIADEQCVLQSIDYIT